MEGGWQAKESYIKKIRDTSRERIQRLGFPVRIVHVKGHTGVEGNEKADVLAGSTTAKNTFPLLMKTL
jgi:ribonuclease HI